MPDNAVTIKIEDARLLFRNFEGKEGPYNRKGDRNFAVVLDDDTAKILERDGWNVKYLKSREDDEPETPYIQVAVNFDNRPPRVVMITSSGRTNLNAESVEILDYADIRLADLIIRPYDWVVNGKSGRKAYLQSLFVTIEEDELERKYGANSVEGQ